MTRKIVYPRLAGIAVVVLLAVLGAEQRAAAAKPAATKSAAAAAAAKTVQVVFDFGDGVEFHYTRLAWKARMTALDALAAASKAKHGVHYDQVGSGTGAKITRIEDVANEGGGRTRRNWIFYVNGKKSDVGSGAAELRVGDVVLWRFETFDYNRP